MLDILKDLEDKKHSINTIVEKLKNIRLGQDDLRIKEYIIKHLHVGNILKITDSIIREFSPYEISLLSNAQHTSIDVERSFSKLNKMASPDRQFTEESWREHIICYCNNDNI